MRARGIFIMTARQVLDEDGGGYQEREVEARQVDPGMQFLRPLQIVEGHDNPLSYRPHWLASTRGMKRLSHVDGCGLSLDQLLWLSLCTSFDSFSFNILPLLLIQDFFRLYHHLSLW